VNTGCLVNAKNRDEILYPSLDSFFNSSCSIYGCYNCYDGSAECADVLAPPRINYVSTSDLTGSMWQSGWAGNQESWSIAIDCWMAQAEYQKLIAPLDPYLNAHPDWDRYTDEYFMGGQDAEIYYFNLYGSQLRYTSFYVYANSRIIPYGEYWYGGELLYIGTFLNFIPQSIPYSSIQHRYTEGYVELVETISSGALIQYWTSLEGTYVETCRVSVYAEEFCGYYQYNSDGKAKKDFYFTPANDYASFGIELMFDSSGNPVVYDSCAIWFQGCSGTIGLPITGWDSISIQGPCIAATESVDGNGNTVYRNFIENNKYGSPQMTSLTDSESWWIFGCWGQCHNPPACSGWAPCCEPDVVYNPRIDGLTRTSLKVYPLFPSYHIEINVRTELIGTSGSTKDDFNLGLRTHPYLCSEVDLYVLGGFYTSPGLDNDGYSEPQVLRSIPASVQLLPREPMYVTSTVLPQFDEIYILYTSGYVAIDAHTFTTCSSAGRTVLPCPTCVVAQPEGIWQFDQRTYNPNQVDFIEDLDTMYQTTGTLSSGTSIPEIIVSFMSSTITTIRSYRLPANQLIPYQSLSSLQSIVPRVYSRLISSLKIIDFRIRFFLDNCVIVVQNIDSVIPYSFQKTVCEATINNALCIYDYTKYAMQPGRDLEDCGASCRGEDGVPIPGATAFDLNPLASATLYPQEHIITDDYQAGTLDIYLQLNPIDWKGAWNYLRYNLTDSLVWIFPEFRECISESLSTRPGKTTIGYSPDPNTWIDCDWLSIWPIDCGIRCSQTTGICRYRRAVDSIYCDPDTGQFSNGTTLTPLIDYPLAVLPIDPNTPNLFAIQRCGQTVDPSAFTGPPNSPTNIDFLVLESSVDEYVTLKALRGNYSSWQNTGLVSGIIFTNTTSVYGTFICVNCPIGFQIVIWIAPYSPTYEINNRLVIGITGISPFLFNVTGLNDTIVYQSIGWDFIGIPRGNGIQLGILIVTTPSTISDCLTSTEGQVRHEPPASIDIQSNQNQCVFTPMPGAQVGECYCSDPSTGGKTCESPTILTVAQGKAICSGYGRPGYNTYSTTTGVQIEVDDYGAWNDGENIGCVCLNIGLIFQTRLFFPANRFDYQSIYIIEQYLDQPTYVLSTEETVGDVVSYEDAQQSCNYQSLSLPSFTTGDELNDFYVIMKDATVDPVSTITTLQIIDGNFVWNDIDVTIGTIASAVPVTNVDPCKNTTDLILCEVINWNNLLWNTTQNGLTDGSLTLEYTTVSSSLLMTIPKLNHGLTVELYFVSVPFSYVVSVTEPAVSPCTIGSSSTIWTCSLVGVEQIEISFTSGSGIVIQEITAYDLLDNNRFSLLP